MAREVGGRAATAQPTGARDARVLARPRAQDHSSDLLAAFADKATADRHRDIAKRIRGLGSGPRHNATERFIVERESLAREVEMLGHELAEGER